MTHTQTKPLKPTTPFAFFFLAPILLALSDLEADPCFAAKPEQTLSQGNEPWREARKGIPITSPTLPVDVSAVAKSAKPEIADSARKRVITWGTMDYWHPSCCYGNDCSQAMCVNKAWGKKEKRSLLQRIFDLIHIFLPEPYKGGAGTSTTTIIVFQYQCEDSSIFSLKC